MFEIEYNPKFLYLIRNLHTILSKYLLKMLRDNLKIRESPSYKIKILTKSIELKNKSKRCSSIKNKILTFRYFIYFFQNYRLKIFLDISNFENNSLTFMLFEQQLYIFYDHLIAHNKINIFLIFFDGYFFTIRSNTLKSIFPRLSLNSLIYDSEKTTHFLRYR